MRMLPLVSTKALKAFFSNRRFCSAFSPLSDNVTVFNLNESNMDFYGEKTALEEVYSQFNDGVLMCNAIFYYVNFKDFKHQNILN